MMRSRNGAVLIHALLLFHFVTLGGICDDGRSICDLVPSFEQDVTGGYTIRLSTYESKWDTLTAVVSMSGIQWLSIPMVLQWENEQEQYWMAESIDLPPSIALYYWFIMGDGREGETDSLTDAKPWIYRSEESGDQDADGLPDDWEKYWWGNSNRDPSANADSDAVGEIPLTDAYEYMLGTDPTASNNQNEIAFIWNPSKPSPGEWVSFSFFIAPDDMISIGKISAAVSGQTPGELPLQIIPLTYDEKIDRYTGSLRVPFGVQNLVILLINDQGIIDDNYGLGWSIHLYANELADDRRMDESEHAKSETRRGYRGLNRSTQKNGVNGGIVYVDAQRGNDSWDGMTKEPNAGQGPKKRIDRGTECLCGAGGIVVIAAGVYSEPGLMKGSRIRLEPQGHVTVRCR